jgi:hypothetical protein
MQVPAPVGVRVDPKTVHGPESILNEFSPKPFPPFVISESAEP